MNAVVAITTEAGQPVSAPASVAASVERLELQSVDNEKGEEIVVARDDYGITAPPPPPKKKKATTSSSGSTSTASVGGSGGVRWPFAGGAPISSHFGYRAAPCSGCPTWHKGTDFTPGAGVAIGSIAAGTVTTVTYAGDYGNYAIISHSINGQKVESLYAHMQSTSVHVGQKVSAGSVVGTVGSTGASTGSHLHLEVIVNGENVDPYVWLNNNAG